MAYADSHIHVADPRFKGIDSGAEVLFGCSSTPDEWDYLSRMVGGKIVRFYGTHPWYSERTDLEGLERMLQEDREGNVGEIGLDSKKGRLDDQMHPFVSQLELAEKYGRIANIHMIGCESEMLRILREHKVTCILHSFSGPESYIKPFAECGCFFSISPRIHRKSKEKAASLISKIPKDRLLIETDSPDNPMGMDEHMVELSLLMGMSCSELEELTLRNARSLLP
jgi:TatD DNase family protein